MPDQSPDTQLIIDEVRRFVEREVLPVAHTLEKEDCYPIDLIDKLREMGVFAATIPEAYGGLGLDFLTYVQIVEEIARGWMSLSGIVNTHVLVAYMITAFGAEEQRQRFLPVMAEGERRGGLCISEASAGSDVQAITMTATRDGDNYILQGSKLWVTNGVNASIFAVLARTDTQAHPPYRGMSIFLVEKGTPGLQVGRTFDKLGYKGVDTAELVFESVRVPAANLLGGREGEGFKHAMSGLEVGRINVAAVPVTIDEFMVPKAGARPNGIAAGAGRRDLVHGKRRQAHRPHSILRGCRNRAARICVSVRTGGRHHHRRRLQPLDY